MADTQGSDSKPDGESIPGGSGSVTEVPGSLSRDWFTEEMEVAAANALLDAGFIDPDDGTIPLWLADDQPPVWTHPSEAVKVTLQAIAPMVGDLQASEGELMRQAGYEAGVKKGRRVGEMFGREIQQCENCQGEHFVCGACGVLQ